MKKKEVNSTSGKTDSKGFSIQAILILGFIAAVALFFVFILNPEINPPKYDVIFIDSISKILTLEVYAADTTGKELINTNDEILKKYNNQFPSIFIFYFDNISDTTGFFTLFPKANLSPEEQKSIMHNIAMYYYDRSAINNCLNKRLDAGWSILKCY